MIDQRALSAQVYHILKERIINDVFKPGEKLSIEALAEEFGVSRSPVKVAIDQLREEGLVAVARNHGTFVNTLSEREVIDRLNVREMMEAYAACAVSLPVTGRVAEVLAHDLAEEEKLLGAPMDDTVFLRRNDLNAHFHETLLEAADNAYLTRLYRRVNVRMVVLRSYRKRPLRDVRDVYREHVAIYQAALRNSNAALEQAVVAHTVGARQAFLKERSAGKDGTVKQAGGSEDWVGEEEASDDR